MTEVQTLSRSSQSGIISDQTATVLETMSAGNSNSTSNAKGKDESGGGLSTGAIVGISVVAGVVVLGLVLFLIWKLKQKRFASFDDDDGECSGHCSCLHGDSLLIIFCVCVVTADGIKWYVAAKADL